VRILLKSFGTLQDNFLTIFLHYSDNLDEQPTWPENSPAKFVNAPKPDKQMREEMKRMEPTREQVSVCVFHCGAGCTLGDIIGEAGLFVIGGSWATFVAGSEFGTKLAVDFALAYGFGHFLSILHNCTDSRTLIW
jgi:hypothetical protein